ncbi:MAG TPA: (deoxy)nucleoside triphosphate pyrophosphohydrolase [Oleiagrimonas sp.]|nr:(deoxy)nucleoside triphosphate pyrophosphohydrolase [Oleiagrimonas sp.]
MMHVAAGVLVDAEGRVLLAERPPGKHLAGDWEFPGGKLEPGETAVDALRRELREELAIEAGVIDALPLIAVPWRHGEVDLCLVAHRVRSWRGTPRPCEGQSLAWSLPAEVASDTLAPADRPILHVLRLPGNL